MGETRGQGDLGYTVEPNQAPSVEYEPLEMDVDSVESFAKAIIAEADNFGDAASEIKAQLSNAAAGERGHEVAYPVGADPDDETLHRMAGTHAERMEEMNTLMGSVQTGIRNLGVISQMLMRAYGSQDALNAAKQADVAALIDDAYATGEKPEGADA